MSDPRLNLVFLGCGRITAIHSRTLARFRDRVRCFYASRDRERAMAYERRFRGAGSFGSYEAALADGSMDVALVATPPASHLDLTLAALASRKHVIVEKPAFPRARDFETVSEAIKAAGKRVLVAENYAYKPLASGLSAADERAALEKIAGRSAEPLLAYGSDEDNFIGVDPETLPFDLGSDVIAFARKRIAIANPCAGDLPVASATMRPFWVTMSAPGAPAVEPGTTAACRG